MHYAVLLQCKFFSIFFWLFNFLLIYKVPILPLLQFFVFVVYCVKIFNVPTPTHSIFMFNVPIPHSFNFFFLSVTCIVTISYFFYYVFWYKLVNCVMRKEKMLSHVQRKIFRKKKHSLSILSYPPLVTL